jgi:ATP-dependent DNA ligase
MKIHCMEDGTVEIYSRNAERNTGKYPDVVDAVSRYYLPSHFTYQLFKAPYLYVVALVS